MLIPATSNLAQLFWRGPELMPIAIALACLIPVVLVWLYGAQIQPLRGLLRWFLPAMRGLVFLLLILALLKPVATRLASPAERGELLVLVDRSRSMSIVDNRRTPAQQVALADAMGALPPDTRVSVAEEFSTALERLAARAAEVKGAQDDLDYARISGHDIEAGVAHLRESVARYGQLARTIAGKESSLPDDSDLRRDVLELADVPAPDARDAWRTDVPARIGHAVAAAAAFQGAADEQLYANDPDVRAACEQIAGLSRFDLAQRALLRPHGGLLSRLGARANVSIFGISDQPIALGLPPPTAEGGFASLGTAPIGYASDLTGCIAQAVAGRRVRGIVLLSDGRQVGGDSTVASGLTPEGVPIFAVEVAAPGLPPRDLAFGRVQLPSSVFAGQSFRVTAELRHENLSGFPVTVHLRTEEGQEQQKSVTIRDDPRAAAVTFTLNLAQPGAQKLRLWFDRVPGEATEVNDQAERWVKVVPQRMRVLLVAGTPGWDFQLFRNLMARSREVELTDRIIDPGRPHLSLTSREVRDQDVIVLFDVPVAALDASQWDAVEQLAERDGGSVILVAGGVHLPAEYGRGAPIAVARLMPYDVTSFTPAWRVWPGESPEFHFDPTPQAQARGFPRLTEEGENDLLRWEQLPGVYRFVQLPDPHGEAWRRQVRPLLVESESGLPVLTEMRLGAGRSFFLGIDETWRWRRARDRNDPAERDQQRLWRQLITYAADQPYFVRTALLSLDADKIAAEPNEPIHFRARIASDALASVRGPALTVLRDGRLIETVPLARAGSAGSGRFTGTASLPAGDFEAELSVALPRGGRPVVIRMPLHVFASDAAEMADVSGDDRMLRKLADVSGGQFLRLDQVKSLPDRLESAGDARLRYAELPIWDSPYLFCVIVGCLGVEWALRKHVGLA